MSQIKYNKQVTSCGRNGIVKQVALDVYPTTRIDDDNEIVPVIVLNPVNSYGQLTSGSWIEIPMEHVEELIKQLEYFKDDYTTRP